MDDMKANHIIKSIRNKWIWHSILSDALIAGGAGFLLMSLLRVWPGASLWIAPVAAAFFFVLLLVVHRVWRIKETGIVQLLDQTYPQLEESTHLLLQTIPSLNRLEQLQHKKTGSALLAIDAPLKLGKKLVTPLSTLLISLLAGLIIMKYLAPLKQETASSTVSAGSVAIKKEILLPAVANINLTIVPPAYTGKQQRIQHAFNLAVEEGSDVSWQLQTNIAAGKVSLLFNDKQVVELKATGAGYTQWRLLKKIDSTGFYQLNIDGRLSELYKIETIPDKPPVITVQSPKQFTTIDFGQPQQVKTSAAVTDDYGVQDAYIAATIASGSGEAVKFKEQKIPLKGFAPGNNQYAFQQWLSLPALGMQPGDELYFYVQATDNHKQQTRSDIYIVHLPDTAQLMSLEGLGNSLTLKPEYFRSQRQIIIDAEQLLKDRDTITEERFKNRSNNLGIDQKLLRLRYGKFLGDESSGETEGADGLGDIADFGNAEKVIDAFTDHHDNSEDATYLDPATKKQLRAVLNEMWDSEIHLRTFTPREALPFAYKALRLLKELQQKSRVYVAKTNFKTTSLDPKKRLSGDLTKIYEPRLQKDITPEPDWQQPLREALSVLEKVELTGALPAASGVLQQANLRLHEQAMQQPAVYVKAVEAMKRILAASSSTIKDADMRVAQQGLQQLLSVPAQLPSANKGGTKQNLSQQYFKNLQNRQP